MIFNSYEFIFAFLPAVWIGYFLLNKWQLFFVRNVWLVISSLFFYSWWNPVYLPLISASMLINYYIGTLLGKASSQPRARLLLTVGITANLAALGYYKYYDFFIENLNALLSTDFNLLHLALPLAISFFTFQQIAYLVDAYRKETKEYDFWKYALFVSFFPQLIAGPIVHHNEMMPQFSREKAQRKFHYENFAKGIFIFSIGLFKKVVIADTFAVWATAGFDQAEMLTFIEAWIVSLSYTFQLYFDFSGYTDMAMGAALLFNVRLPVNFNSPYKAVNIQDFWKRWHMTLTRFLTQYLYIPLGGNRKGIPRTYVNVFLVFFVSGLWHGAGWTFVLWGTLHGAASMLNRLWKQLGFKMNRFLGWFITFQFVNFAWVFFRAQSWEDAEKVLKGMFGMSGFSWPEQLTSLFTPASVQAVEVLSINAATDTSLLYMLALLGAAFAITLWARNSIRLMDQLKPSWFSAFFICALLLISFFSMTRVSEFLYFNF
ncbi:MBOAT family O-acyltransferase [Bacillus sp. NTK034]|uniref:MBOAT family O-acyltransferase n=1 Tax=Bacillus sp. NTK034 TaxID=2802176 RepID=UPI001A8DE6B1|nr:MBOAT family protein [Bacillus sp. NTK034]MBN8201508.1 MBOAT family protein [Bacillus sp. NTK034]